MNNKFEIRAIRDEATGITKLFFKIKCHTTPISKLRGSLSLFSRRSQTNNALYGYLLYLILSLT
jgi:hypothetical protein